MRFVLRLVLWLAAILLILVATAAWWLVYRPLPQLDGTLPLAGLHGKVTVERDGWGVPHIRADSVEDLVEAQGYVMAQDRLWQMDLLRRVGRGRLSEILGRATLDIDKDFRRLNFSRTADRELQQMDAQTRTLMEAYARGVNHFIEQNQARLPVEFTLLKYKAEPWQPSDTLIIAGYMYRTLADTRDEELKRAKVTAKVGPELAKDLYSPESSMDHFVVGDPEVDRAAHELSQAGSDDDEDDDDDFDDILTASRTPGHTSEAAASPDLTSYFAQNVKLWITESERDIRHTLGSNNWVVSGAHTATGKPLLANDTHLELTIPPIWYEAHLTAPGWNVKGFTLPGSPMVIIGHNDRIAWGFTNNGADVLDLYIETMNPENPDQYRVNGKWQQAEVYDEVIHVKGAPDEHLELRITRHGPIVEEDQGTVYAMKWTALQPGGLSSSYNWLGKAQNWDEFREALSHVWGPAQNAVYADVDGNIGYCVGAKVPIRKKGHGEVPVPGDTDDYEWIGYIPFDQMPQSFNPDSGLIVTANARVAGPDYKPFLTENWEEPYRTARIYDLLHDKQGLRPEDMLKVETDTYSFPHAFIAEQLIAAAKTVSPKDKRTAKLIQEAKDWNGIAEPDSSVVSFLNASLFASLDLVLEPYLGSDTKQYRWRRINFLQKILTDRPTRWLPQNYKNYDELLIAAADRAVNDLQTATHKSDPNDWPWKHFNSLDMLHPLGREGFLKKALSLTNEPQAGTQWSPRAASRHHGPAMRFVANPADWDDSILLIPAGQSGQPGSEHYKDQFSYWFEGKPIYGAFSDAAESKLKKHTLVLQPAP